MMSFGEESLRVNLWRDDMDIESYKQRCLNIESRKRKWHQQYDEQRKYGECYRPRRKLFKVVCPCCGKKLSEASHYHVINNIRFNGIWRENRDRRVLYECGCGYVYAQ